MIGSGRKGKMVPKIGAVVLAAGLSTRMGKPKMLLPWGEKTIIEQIVGTLLHMGVDQIIIVTGVFHEQMSKLFEPENPKVELVTNLDYSDGEMLHSLQVGLCALSQEIQGVLIVLGDQPHIQGETVMALLQEWQLESSDILIPSYQLRRGHPWLVSRKLWQEILDLKNPRTLRDFLKDHSLDIHYVNVSTSTILEDIDTPDEYLKKKP
jgi:molybdenum cofactor cytidylyltransferase